MLPSKLEVVSIGNEVLRGMVINTNAAYLGRRLEEEGYHVAHQATLPDEPLQLTAGLQEGLDRSSIVISTGGIGPTLDDITLASAKKLFSSAPATLRNTLGSASGSHFHENNRHLFLLPGVPEEMEVMFEQEVLPILKRIVAVLEKEHQIKLHFSMLSETAIDPYLRKLQAQYPLEIGIYPSYATLVVVLRGANLEVVKKAVDALKRQFAEHFYESSSGKIEEVIQNWMIKRRKTLASAESCTGGALASSLVAIPGASNYFLGSLVAYSNELKKNLLNVSSRTLESKGAVSLEAVHEMWSGVLQITQADYGIAISGIAGPTGGTVQKPVGTVCYAMGFRGEPPEVSSFHVKGSRSVVILRTTALLLALIWKQLKTVKN